MTEYHSHPLNPAYVYPHENAVYLGEDAYSYMPLHCPFCGARQDAACPHRLAVLDSTYFTAITDDFAVYLGKFAGLQGRETIGISTLLPKRLWTVYHSNEDLVLAAVKELNSRLPDGNGVIIFLVRNKMRLDRRAAVFGSSFALSYLDPYCNCVAP